MAEIEARLIRAFEALGVLMTNTCINYQTILPPVRGEHLAFGDTGVVIYSNSVMGARSNFEGGPSALAAGLTGRTPRYGYHLDEHRAGTKHFASRIQPADPSDWGALRRDRRTTHQQLLGGAGRHGHRRPAEFRQLKHFGAALASFGSVAMFHMPGVTPEAQTLADAFGRPAVPARFADRRATISTPFMSSTRRRATRWMWWCSPRRSSRCIEMQQVAALLSGRRIHDETTLIVCTSPEIKFAADRMGLTRRIEEAGRHRRRRRLLLPELCARDGRGERLAASAHQLGQAGEHHRRLRLQADARPACSAASTARSRGGSSDADRAAMPPRASARRHGHALVAEDNFSARYDLDRQKGVFSRPAHKLTARAM